MEYDAINALSQFLKKYKNEDRISAEGFMEELESTVAELQNRTQSEPEKRLIIDLFSAVANYLHAIKKRAFF